MFDLGFSLLSNTYWLSVLRQWEVCFSWLLVELRQSLPFFKYSSIKTQEFDSHLPGLHCISCVVWWADDARFWALCKLCGSSYGHCQLLFRWLPLWGSHLSCVGVLCFPIVEMHGSGPQACSQNQKRTNSSWNAGQCSYSSAYRLRMQVIANCSSGHWLSLFWFHFSCFEIWAC